MEYPFLHKKGHIPFGYEDCKYDSELWQPIPSQLDALKQALEYCKTCSLREVAVWLSTKTGRYISYVALHYRMKRDFDKQLSATQAKTTGYKATEENTQEQQKRTRKTRTRRKNSSAANKRKTKARRKKTTANRKRESYFGRVPKRNLTPRISKPSLRERGYTALPDNIQT